MDTERSTNKKLSVDNWILLPRVSEGLITNPYQKEREREREEGGRERMRERKKELPPNIPSTKCHKNWKKIRKITAVAVASFITLIFWTSIQRKDVFHIMKKAEALALWTSVRMEVITNSLHQLKKSNKLHWQ